MNTAVPEKTDEELAQLVQGGEAEAFGVLMHLSLITSPSPRD